MAHISNVRETSFKWLPLSLNKSSVFIYYTLIWKAFKHSNIWGKKVTFTRFSFFFIGEHKSIAILQTFLVSD